MVEHACGIIKYEAVNLSYADNDLEWVTESMPSCYEGCNDEAERAPGELNGRS